MNAPHTPSPFRMLIIGITVLYLAVGVAALLFFKWVMP